MDIVQIAFPITALLIGLMLYGMVRYTEKHGK